MEEHNAREPYPAAPCSDAASLASGPEAWRVEVDQIIAAIHPRTNKSSAPSSTPGCTATLVIPKAPCGADAIDWPDDRRDATARLDCPEPNALPMELAHTDPGTPCQAALQAPPALPSFSDPTEVTSPAHPAAQASLRAACTPCPPRSTGNTYAAPLQLQDDEETDAGEASTREHPLNYPLPPSPFAHVCNAEPRRGGWVFDSAASETALEREVIQASMDVHRTLGPGLRPHIYARCLGRELTLRGLRAEQDVPMAVSYKGETLEDAFRASLLVEGSLLVDVQGVTQLEPAHEAHLRTFLVQSGVRSALLINFHEPELIHGIRSWGR